MFFTLDSQDNVLMVPLNGFLLGWILTHICAALISGFVFLYFYFFRLVPWLGAHFYFDRVFISVWDMFYTDSLPIQMITSSSLAMNSIVFGAILGLVERQILRRRVAAPAAWWHINLIGWPVGNLLIHIATVALDTGYPAKVGKLLLILVTIAIISRFGQKYLLGIKFIRSQWWTIVGILSWTTGYACATFLGPTFILSDGIAGGVAGLITGVILLPVIKQPDL